MEIVDISILLSIIGAITIVTNILVQVLKKVTWDKLPTNFVVLIVSEALTLSSGIAYGQIKDISITWYMVGAAIVVGFMVAYAAMFGFDKLKESLAGLRK